jgi:hypothetical protein
VVHTFHLLMTPDELAVLQAKLDQAIRPYVALNRDDAPEDAGAVRLHLRAFGESGVRE